MRTDYYAEPAPQDQFQALYTVALMNTQEKQWLEAETAHLSRIAHPSANYSMENFLAERNWLQSEMESQGKSQQEIEIDLKQYAIDVYEAMGWSNGHDRQVRVARMRSDYFHEWRRMLPQDPDHSAAWHVEGLDAFVEITETPGAIGSLIMSYEAELSTDLSPAE